jgi:hypothetical protein
MLIEQKRQKLNEEMRQIAQIKRSIDQQKYDLQLRESKLVELEPLIPSVKQLQNMGVTFDLILPYMETINETAVVKSIDLKAAAYNLAHDLREYRQLGSLQKCVEQVKQQLAVRLSLRRSSRPSRH